MVEWTTEPVREPLADAARPNYLSFHGSIDL